MERGRKRFPTESLKVAEEEEEEEEQIAREIQSIAARKKNRAGWGMWELQTNAYEKDQRQDRRPGAEMEEWSKYNEVRIGQDKVGERLV